MPTWIVPADTPTQSAKDFLRKHTGVSLTLWRKIKRQSVFSINGQAVPPALSSVQSGDVIRYTIAQSTSLAATALPLQIRFEDEYLLVADKPAGQLVHPTTKERTHTLANAVLYHYAQTHQPFDYHPVHRLDKNTSGLVLIAKLPHIQHLLSFTAAGKAITRKYLAIISGRPAPPSGAIDAPIGRRPDSIIERMVKKDGQRAVTHYQTLRANETYSLLEVQLETGRTHQIRVHLAHIGCPILGDDLYGGSVDRIPRQALHAAYLHFIHPVSHVPLDLYSPLPPDIQTIANTLK